MSDCWDKDTAGVMISEIVKFIDQKERPNKDDIRKFANPDSTAFQFLKKYGSLCSNNLDLTSHLYPSMMVLPVIKSDKNPDKFIKLISKLKSRIPGLQTFICSSEPPIHKTRGRYIFQNLLKLISKDEVLLKIVADELGSDLTVLKAFIDLPSLHDYSVMFNPNIFSIVNMARSLNLDVFLSLAKILINSDRFKSLMQESTDLKINYLFWMFNLIDYPGVSIDEIYLNVSKVYFPISKVRFYIDIDTNQQDITQVSGINYPKEDLNKDLDKNKIKNINNQDVDLETKVEDNKNDHKLNNINSKNNNEDDDMNNNNNLVMLYGVGLGVGVGAVFLPYALGIGALASSAVGGAAGFGVSSFSFFNQNDNNLENNSSDNDNSDDIKPSHIHEYKPVRTDSASESGSAPESDNKSDSESDSEYLSGIDSESELDLDSIPEVDSRLLEI